MSVRVPGHRRNLFLVSWLTQLHYVTRNGPVRGPLRSSKTNRLDSGKSSPPDQKWPALWKETEGGGAFPGHLRRRRPHQFLTGRTQMWKWIDPLSLVLRLQRACVCKDALLSGLNVLDAAMEQLVGQDAVQESTSIMVDHRRRPLLLLFQLFRKTVCQLLPARVGTNRSPIVLTVDDTLLDDGETLQRLVSGSAAGVGHSSRQTGFIRIDRGRLPHFLDLYWPSVIFNLFLW